MKKLICILFTFALITACLFICGCKEDNVLTPHVSELRQDIFEGKSESYTLKAYYGYNERIHDIDGVKNSPTHKLSFMLKGLETDTVTYRLIFEYDGQKYNQDFALHPVKNLLIANLEIEGFNEKSFDVSVMSGSSVEKVRMTSIVPKNALTYAQALTKLIEQQPDLIKSYTDTNGNFQGEVIERIIVKNNKAYWYIGLVNKEKNLKALLIDGENGKVLAIREIF